MKEWDVNVFENFKHSVYVKAETESEALEKAYEIFTGKVKDNYWETESLGFTYHTIQEEN